MILIDTNILIEIERDNEGVLDKLEALNAIKEEICITTATYTEYYLGLMKFSKDKLETEQKRLDKYKLLNTSKNSSRILAEIKYNLSKKGIMIPLFDLVIASIAIDSKMPLITLDDHFRRIPNLNVILI